MLVESFMVRLKDCELCDFTNSNVVVPKHLLPFPPRMVCIMQQAGV